MHFSEYANRQLESKGYTAPAKTITSDRYQPPADSKSFAPKIEIDDEVYDKVMHWVDKSNFEVSGLGMVEHDAERNVLRVTDVMLLPQKNTQVSTEIDGAAIAKAMFLMKDKPGSLRWWWHSHVDMGVFWSGTDIATIKQLGGGGWFIATVFNKKRELKSAYCQIEPIPMVVDNLETSLLAPAEDLEKIARWDAEYDKNVINETLAEKVERNFPGWGSYSDGYGYGSEPVTDKKELPSRPEDADIYPREQVNDSVINELGQGLSNDEIVSYFTLAELYDMRERGHISDDLFTRALEEASDKELDEFWESKNMEDISVEEMNKLDMSTRSVDNDPTFEE